MTNLRILKCYVTVTSSLHLQAGLAHNCLSCIASSLPSGQRLMTWTKWLSHLTHYLAIHVSIIHQTIGGRLHKRASKVTRKLCAEWRQFIGRNKRQAVMALHVLHLTLIGKQRCVTLPFLFPTDGKAAFCIFLKSEFCEENIEFWSACEDFRKHTSHTELASKANSIYEEFIKCEAPKEVTASLF